MEKLSVKPPSNSSDNSFKTLADVTEKLSHSRSDGVAITGIVGLVLAFMMVVLVGGLVVYAANQNAKTQINPNPVNAEQLSRTTK